MLFFWRRGWDSTRSLRELVADKPLCGCVGRTAFEVLNRTRPENKMGPVRGPISVFWRRGWDSNPRYGRTVHLISSQAHSTSLAPLLNSAFFLCRWPAAISTPDLTRIASGRFSPLRGARGVQNAFAFCRVRPIRPLWHLSSIPRSFCADGLRPSAHLI